MYNKTVFMQTFFMDDPCMRLGVKYLYVFYQQESDLCIRHRIEYTISYVVFIEWDIIDFNFKLVK